MELKAVFQEQEEFKASFDEKENLNATFDSLFVTGEVVPEPYYEVSNDSGGTTIIIG